MISMQSSRLTSIRLLAILIVLAQLAVPLSAQQPAQLPAGAPVQELSQQLATIEKTIDQKRQELGIPGAS
ncbi:MAG TPA: hypothetical protein VER98_15360, partial [Terriglobia bacterium]|nr:hypothetical protein [Terriglobia bacterium]